MQVVGIIIVFLSVIDIRKADTSNHSTALDTRTTRASNESCEEHVYIFMNPGSGGGKGAELLSAGIRGMRLSLGESHVVLSVYDLRYGESGKKPGFLDISKLVNDNSCIDSEHPVRIIAAGGDGTVVWAMSESVQYGIDITKVVFGTIPFGTGNDFAFVYGWGSDPPKHLLKHQFKELKKLLLQWLSADLVPHDLWNVRIHIDPARGRILQYSGSLLRRIPLAGTDGTLEKMMGNYFSLGAESRIGFDFDRSRTKRRALNKAVYAWMGSKRLVSRESNVGEYMEMCSDGGDILFTTNENEKSGRSLIGTPSSLIFLNINSFAAGLDLWASASKVGVRNPKRSVFDPQDSGDGKLEVMAYNSLLGIVVERIRKGIGKGHRIGQSQGPFLLKFRDHGSLFRIYLQVDGEYYAAERPESVEISHNMTMRVLRKHKELRLE